MGEWKRFLIVLLILAICVAIVGYTVYEAWMGLTGQMEVRQAEARARAAEADALRLREASEKARADAAIAEAKGEADATRIEAGAAAEVVEAGARAVNRQSFVAMMYGVLTPFGVVIALILAIVAGLAIGALFVLVTTRLVGTGTAEDAGVFIRAYMREQARRKYNKR